MQTLLVALLPYWPYYWLSRMPEGIGTAPSSASAAGDGYGKGAQRIGETNRD
jgi:hypothetical protein